MKEIKRDFYLNKLINKDDSFKKIVIIGDVSKPRMDENGITTMGIYYFLLNENSLDL